MIKRLIAISLALLVVSCSSRTPPAPVTDPSTDLTQYIDNTIIGSERDHVSAFIRAMPDDVKYSKDIGVVLIDAGNNTIETNRVSLRNSIAFKDGSSLNLASLPQNDHLGTQGYIQPACTSKKSGAFYRDYTDPGNFTKLESRVFIPNSIDTYDFETYPAGDDAYIYTGGTGGGSLGQDLDAGLKHNTVRNTWEPFIKVPVPGRPLLIVINADYATSNYRTLYRPGQYINLTFLVVKDPVTLHSFIMLTTSGINIDGTVAMVTFGMDTDNPANNLFGWDPTQSTIRLKRMVSIAQNVPYVTSVGNGADFIRTGSYIRNAAWVGSLLTLNGSKVNYPLTSQNVCASQNSVSRTITGTSDVKINISLAP